MIVDQEEIFTRRPLLPPLTAAGDNLSQAQTHRRRGEERRGESRGGKKKRV